jgi:hypothetical protein
MQKEDLMSAVKKFIASARMLHAEEADPAKRWEKMTPLLQELFAKERELFQELVSLRKK